MNFKPQILQKRLLFRAPFLLVLFGNLWIWRIFSTNFLVGLAATFSSFFLYKSIRTQKVENLLIVFLLILFISQFKNTKIFPLTYLNEQERVIQLQRLNEHPPVKLSLGSKIIWIPTAHWLEGRREILIIYRIQENLKNVLSPNLYFFANHPNERVGIKEYDKFPYILFPFFVIGLLNLKFRKNISLGILFLAPIILVAILGDKVDTEPVSLFPFMTITCVNGIEYAQGNISKLKSPNLKKAVISIFILIYVLVLAQTAYYNFS